MLTDITGAVWEVSVFKKSICEGLSWKELGSPRNKLL